MCKRIVLEGLCRLGEKCAYKHRRMLSDQSGEHDNVVEEVKKLREELELMKTTYKLTFDIMKESEIVKA